MPLVAPFKFSELKTFEKDKICTNYFNPYPSIFNIKDILSKDEVDFLIAETTFKNQIGVSVTGKVNETQDNDVICSYRLTAKDEDLAEIVYKRISHILSPLYQNPYKNNEIWKPVGVNPAFRYIKYTDNGLLVPHYDFPYVESENRMTLMSLVLYLTTNEDGTTDFVREYRENDDSDWKYMAEPHQIYFQNKPVLGSALLFPHNMLHQGNKLSTPKTIIRTDIMYERA